MQFKLRGLIGRSLLGLLLTLALLARGITQAMAKKFPKGYVHDTAGDGAPPPPLAAPVTSKTALWIQYDRGGVYYYNKNDIPKARAYLMAALQNAEGVLPQERARGMSSGDAYDCCGLIAHLCWFVNNDKFRPVTNQARQDAARAAANPLQYQLDNAKDSLKQLYQDWDWYERVCGFANRAIGRQNDCMRKIYLERTLLERKIVFTRRTALACERQMGIPEKSHTTRQENKR